MPPSSSRMRSTSSAQALGQSCGQTLYAMSSGNAFSGNGYGREYQDRAIVVKRSMPAAGLDDPILKRFRTALDQLYGDRIERVVLFGSRARGDAREDSDYDLAVF